MLKLMGKKICTIFAQKFCLSKPMVPKKTKGNCVLDSAMDLILFTEI